MDAVNRWPAAGSFLHALKWILCIQIVIGAHNKFGNENKKSDDYSCTLYKCCTNDMQVIFL